VVKGVMGCSEGTGGCNRGIGADKNLADCSTVRTNDTKSNQSTNE